MKLENSASIISMNLTIGKLEKPQRVLHSKVFNTSTYNNTKQMVFGKDYFYVSLVFFSAVHGAPVIELFEKF